MNNLFILFIIGLIFLPNIVWGFTLSEITNYNAPEAIFYPQEFDKLVLDFTLPSGRGDQDDTFLAITLRNTGTARDIQEIRELILWKDAAKIGFQGLGIDQKLGQFIFYSNEIGWYLSGLNVPIKPEGQRFFVSVETSRVAVVGKSIRLEIPQYQDQNQNVQFEPGDLGIFLASKNNGPTDNRLLNLYYQTMRQSVVDSLPPKVVITDPLDGATITTSTYKISGMARDQGGSSPQWLKITISSSTSQETDEWRNVVPKSDYYYTWEYNWLDIAEGTYLIKTRAVDWFDNTTTSEINLNVAFPKTEPATTTLATTTTPATQDISPPAPVSPELSVAELEAKIAILKKKIQELLTQLIQIIQQKITGLKKQL